jgi:hypothetical protein
MISACQFHMMDYTEKHSNRSIPGSALFFAGLCLTIKREMSEIIHPIKHL